MRGALILLLIAGILLSGCAQQPAGGNVTNQTNATPPVQTCSGPVCGADGTTYNTDCEAALANVSVLHIGECEAAPACTDSDAGMNVTVAGNVTLGDQSYPDHCDADGKLLEYTCEEGNVVLVVYDCGEGKECSDGRCIEKPPAPPENVTPNVTIGCSGPTEADIYVKDSVTFNANVFEDACTEYRVVKDYFCEDNQLKNISNQCPPGYFCTNGQCNPPIYNCTDTDGGNNVTARGHTIGTKGIITIFDKYDECVDLSILKEYYCLENGTVATDESPCPDMTKCVSGRCVRSDCSDSDGGKNIFKKGVTTDKEGSYEDECFNDHVMEEYYCFGDDAMHDLIDCGQGYICNENTATCVEGSIQ